MNQLAVTPTRLQGLFVVQRARHQDHRGFFGRFFCNEELATHGFKLPIAQINHTRTNRRGAARGLHFQHSPHGEDKFVSCLHGEIWDVAVDLRRGSPTYLQWHAEVLSADNSRSLLVPQGFAHGFQALSDDAELLYLHSRAYAPESEGGLNLADPTLGIEWPLPMNDLSERDSRQPFLRADFVGL